MNLRGAAVVVATLVAGCAASSPSPAALLLARADEQVGAERYESALDLYNEFLQAHATDPAAPRARTARMILARLLASQAEIERLREAEAARGRALGERQSEVERLKAEVEWIKAQGEQLKAEGERLKAEGDRLKAERERLRADLERLRSIDMRPGPRR